jgi:hypothetical protein
MTHLQKEQGPHHYGSLGGDEGEGVELGKRRPATGKKAPSSASLRRPLLLVDHSGLLGTMLLSHGCWRLLEGREGTNVVCQ